MQFWDIDHIFYQHQSVHPHLQVTLRTNQELENLKNILQEATDLRTTVPHNGIEFESILTCPIPVSILLRLDCSHKNWTDLSSVQLRNTYKSRLLSKKGQCLSCSSPCYLEDSSCCLDVDKDLKGYMQEVFSWLLQSSQQSMGYLEDSCQSFLAFLELRFIAGQSRSDAILMLMQSLTSQKHISQYIQQSDRVLG